MSQDFVTLYKYCQTYFIYMKKELLTFPNTHFEPLISKQVLHHSANTGSCANFKLQVLSKFGNTHNQILQFFLFIVQPPPDRRLGKAGFVPRNVGFSWIHNECLGKTLNFHH